MKKLVPILFLFCVFAAFPQEKTLLKGQLVFSSLNISPINIVNTTTHTGTINDAKGEFEIWVSLGDDLLFSSVQYEPQRIKISQEIIDKRWIVVRLVPAVNELDAVTISNIDLSGNLLADIEAVGIKEYYNNASFGLPMRPPRLSVEERRLYTATTGGPGIIPLPLILNAISGRLKKLNQLKDYAELDRLVENATNLMGLEFFVLECEIPENYISDFIYFCAKDSGFKKRIAQNQKLVLVEYFKRKARLYKTWRGW